jgi:hypothetical protein
VKLRIIVLMLCGVAGVGASFAFAAGGTAHGRAAPWCRHNVVFGTASAPQTFTVTLARSWRHSNLQTGQPVQVTLGSTGQTVRFTGVGCVGSDGTLTVNEAGFEVVQHHTRGGDGDGGQTTTTASTGGTTTTNGDPPPTTTNGDHPPTTTNSDNPPTTTNGDNPPPTTTNDNTTTSTTPDF